VKAARRWTALLAGAAVAAVAAIEPPPAEQLPAKSWQTQQEPVPEPTAPQQQPAEKPAAPPAPAEKTDEELPPLPPDVAAGPSPGRFNPSEKVRADFPVSFPIDI
jgi:hypothetical protein